NDINTGLRYNPLNHISSEQAQIEIINSPLSEYAVLGFEYGYSLSYPESLVIWEAQFGDFINGAQIIIDQFISSAEYKWYRLSGLVLYLPHGYEGQGPEHSSARIERFLELCAENNMRVYNLTESAQLFHALRRQTLFKNKKPLVIFTPKSLLRLPEALSPLEKFTDSNFAEIIEDKWQKDAKKITKLLLCSGKVYYDLSNYFKENKDKITDTACIRIEQLFPFPEEKLKKIVSQYASLKKLIWVQEEPENMGAWHFMQNRLKNLLKDGVELNLAARKASPSPAAGLMVYHKKELDEIFRTVFS
ncbi:MAG: 2-oxoglutarate dehydrogenase E1 component, partial [Spirochaetia bacterium]|nr:2-oxoglutarate dehydrogenase E1 component [Spirochaetia bacterium]